MQPYWKWANNRGQVLTRDRVIRCWRLARDRCGLTPEQTRKLLNGAALEEDVNAAEDIYLRLEAEAKRRRNPLERP